MPLKPASLNVLLAIAIVLAGAASAAITNQPVISLIDPGEIMQPGALVSALASGSLSGLPHLELTDLEKLKNCPNKAKCDDTTTHVINLESQAFELEKALSSAWNRYDARVYWRAQTAINQPMQLANCLIGGFDTRLGAWSGSAIENLPSGDFCDEIPFDPTWAPGICGIGSGLLYLDVPKAARTVVEAQAHGLRKYYPDYIKDSLKAVVTRFPTALYPDGLLLTSLKGRAVQALMPPTPNIGLYAKLLQDAQQAETRGAAYLLSANPLLQSSVRPLLRSLPTDQWDLNYPGLRGIELLKAVSTRTAIFERWGQFADNKAFGGTPEPSGESGVSTVDDHARYGHATFMEVHPEVVAEVSPRMPTLGLFCFAIVVGPPWVIPVPLPPLPIPLFHAGEVRLDTRWYSVPEGYALPSAR